jgi:hypothetical protein
MSQIPHQKAGGTHLFPTISSQTNELLQKEIKVNPRVELLQQH